MSSEPKPPAARPRSYDPELEAKAAAYYQTATGRPPKHEILNVEELKAVRSFLRRLHMQMTN